MFRGRGVGGAEANGSREGGREGGARLWSVCVWGGGRGGETDSRGWNMNSSTGHYRQQGSRPRGL